MSKGNETRQMIRQKACNLFAEKGFKDVTMKDICKETGLSRGGLYRHYGSTDQVFSAIVEGLLTAQNEQFSSEIERKISAETILNNILNKYKDEMLDSKRSLTNAIYEYYSSHQLEINKNPLNQQYLDSFSSWNTLIQYGISTGEFKNVDPQSVFDVIVFSYQGVRLYSQMMDIPQEVPDRIIMQIKHLLLTNIGGKYSGQ